MTIIVTGAGGFVGRLLVKELLSEGQNVIAVDRDLSVLTPENGFPIGDNLILKQGDLSDSQARSEIIKAASASIMPLRVVHLAAVPGGAAEGNPKLSRDVNINATIDLLEAVAAAGQAPRVVYASTIAVFGDPLPAAGVDDDTILAPRLIYGAHKAMIETVIATMTRRGEIDGVSLRLPGIIARPDEASGLKSAFMSDLFHSFVKGEEFICPVSKAATLWVMSVVCCVKNLIHALRVEGELLPDKRVMTLPALCVTMNELINEAASFSGQDASLAQFKPDKALEAAFGSHPPLTTKAADHAGFSHDGTLKILVENAFEAI